MTGLAPFRAAADRQRARLARMLGEGRASATEIAVTRVAAVRMAELLATAPGSVLIYDRLGPDAMGMSGADRWTVDEINRAGNVVHPHEGTVEEFTRKYQEYLDLSLEILQWGRVRQEVIVDRQRGRQYLIRGPNPLVPRINQVIGQALMEWGRAQPQTRAFLSQPARTGLVMMLGERPDLVALLRMAQTLPLDVEISDVPIDRPGYVEAIELVIGLIPVVGNAIAAYEAWSGEDLFGYRLTDIERGILAAAVLLPVAGRLAKGGRALHRGPAGLALRSGCRRLVAGATGGGARCRPTASSGGRGARRTRAARRRFGVCDPTSRGRHRGAGVDAWWYDDRRSRGRHGGC